MASQVKPITLDPDRDPWERQPGESSRRFAQFVAYRDAGPARTLQKAAETLTLSAGHVREVARAHLWVRRARAWDAYVDRVRRAEMVEQARKAWETDARVLAAAMSKAAQRLAALNPAEMTVADLTRWLDVMLRHRRVLHGDPTETVRVTGGDGGPVAVELAQFSELPPEVRQARLLELAAQVRRRAEAAAGVDDED